MPDSTEVSEIIVIANPHTITSDNATNPMPGPTNAGGGALEQIKRWEAITNANVTADPDVVSAVNVVAGKLKHQIILFGRTSQNPSNAGGYNLPCIGAAGGAEITSLLQRLKFRITSKNYGVGRAGANNVGSDGANVPVEINLDALNKYAALSGGIQYVIAHEIAHALASMQAYNNAKWQQYIAGAGAGLTNEQRLAQYPASQEFKDNEARANTVGQALLAQWGAPPIGFTPTNGYQVC